MSPNHPNLLTLGAITLVRAYRNLLSPYMLHRCRYYPTCSAYAEAALRRHGLVRGGLKACLRVLRCQPLGGWGYDPAA